MTPLMAVNQLSYRTKHARNWFGKKTGFYLNPISFDLHAGETLAIVGENNSGKSLLAKLLVGAVQQTSGTIRLNGEIQNRGNIKQRCLNIRMIFQHSNESLNPGITLGSILEEPLRLNTQLDHAQRQSKVQATLQQVGLLPEHQYFYRHMLSEGQLQRVALARALILEPQIIVADEPFAALDPSVRSQTVNLLMGLQRELGLGFIFISHNLGLVRHISDKTLVMQSGIVVESGKTDVIFNWPKSEYTQKLIKAHQSLIAPR